MLLVQWKKFIYLQTWCQQMYTSDSRALYTCTHKKYSYFFLKLFNIFKISFWCHWLWQGLTVYFCFFLLLSHVCSYIQIYCQLHLAKLWCFPIFMYMYIKTSSDTEPQFFVKISFILNFSISTYSTCIANTSNYDSN